MTTENNIHIADIDFELKALWEKNKAEKKIKACLFNLIIYTKEERRADYFKDIIVAIIEKFPCRIIFIQRNSKSDEDYLNVTVSNEIYNQGNATITCDEITIQVSGKLIERVPYIISPHLVPDLPIYLLWGEDPTLDDEVLPYFQKFADRLIFDTECTGDLTHFSTLMLDKIGALKMEIMDLNWALISPWRDVINQIFRSEQKIENLRHSKQIVIKYNNAKSNYFHHNEVQALYLQAWLASRLCWEIVKAEREGEAIHLKYKTEQGPLQITLLPENQPNLRYGAIVKLDVETYEDKTYSVCRQYTLHKVIIHISDDTHCDLPFTLPLPDLKRGFNFMKEIFYEKTSVHYLDMLKQLAKTDWKKIY